MINNHEKSNFRRLVVIGECSGENRRRKKQEDSEYRQLSQKIKRRDKAMTEGEVETKERSRVCGMQVYVLLYVGL